MNLELLEQFGQNYPEEFDGILDCISFATVAAFNRRGSVLAVGCNDGRIFIWDFLTRGIAKIISAHVVPVTSLTWSRNGKLLASSSNDYTISVWDILTGKSIFGQNYNSPISFVQFSPRNHNLLLVGFSKQSSRLLYYTPDEPESEPHTVILHDDDIDLVSSFDRRGEYVYSGNTKGRIQVVRIEHETRKTSFVTSFRVSNTAIRQIEFAPRKKDIFLVNSADRIIRVYNTAEVLATAQLNGNNNSTVASNITRGRKNIVNSNLDSKPDPEPIQKLQDLVNRTTWKKCCFSGGAESDYICAGSIRQHSLYIWERNVGSLMKILHGTKGEILNDVIWHPIRPVIASIASGVVSVWSQAQVENWSAFAPDFKELEENVEYEERESEFDEADEDRTPTRADPDGTDEEDAIVDVVTPHTIGELLSSDEDEEEIDAFENFPIMVDIDISEIENGGEEGIFEDSTTIPTGIAKSEELVNKPLQPINRNIESTDIL